MSCELLRINPSIDRLRLAYKQYVAPGIGQMPSR